MFSPFSLKIRRKHFLCAVQFFFMKSLFLIIVFPIFAQCFSSSELFKDLEIVRKIEGKREDHLPLMVNYQGQGGYFTMPSARTFETGDLGFAFSSVPPYSIWSLGFQFFGHLETTGNYWIFKNHLEGNFGHLGYGDDADRAANLKLVLIRKKDRIPYLPELAIGWNDFIGTKRFFSFYTVATKQWTKVNLETTLGWGNGRIHGLYGGVAWSPFRKTSLFFKDLMVSVEYDANDYEKHVYEHPKGRTVNHRVNFGAEVALWDLFKVSASSIRGEEVAAGASFHYNFGTSSGFFPKIYDPPVYSGPVDTEPLGHLRKEYELAEELAFAFKEQGFDLYTLYLVPGKEDRLWMKIINSRYREEQDIRERIEYLLAALLPADIKGVTVVVEAEGVPIYEYQFRSKDLMKYLMGTLGQRELQVISPMKEVGEVPSVYNATLLYKRAKPIWTLTFRPWIRTFFGSSKGKFKYEVGFVLGPEGYLFNEIFYSFQGSYTAKSSVQDISSQDRLNPSRIINVRTDSLKYNQSSSFQVPQAFLQKSWNMGNGFYSRGALGYFEVAYAGVGLEALYFPVNSSFAIGIEGATVLKRKYHGLGFQHKIRRWSPDGEVRSRFVGLQYFLDLYYEHKPYNLNFKAMIGQFLARDKGVRFEGARNFKSGLTMGLWYTLTNGGDVINGVRYFDKGVYITLPLDFFLNKSSRSRIGYGMSAWLRDVGAISATGRSLYQTLFWERYKY